MRCFSFVLRSSCFLLSIFSVYSAYSGVCSGPLFFEPVAPALFRFLCLPGRSLFGFFLLAGLALLRVFGVGQGAARDAPLQVQERLHVPPQTEVCVDSEERQAVPFLTRRQPRMLPQLLACVCPPAEAKILPRWQRIERFPSPRTARNAGKAKRRYASGATGRR